MRILHVVPTYFPATRYGGPIYSVHSLSMALAKRGHQVEVFATSVDGAGDSAVPINSPVLLDNVEVTYFSSRFFRRLYWSPDMAKKLKETLGRFDVLHAHSVFLWPTTVACRIARRHGIAHIISPRGMLVDELIRRRGWIRKKAWIQLFEARNLAHASCVHFTAHSEKEDFERLGLVCKSSAVIANGVEHAQAFSSSGVAGDVKAIIGLGRYLLLLGRISWKKGIERLIGAMVHLPGERAVIVGNDEEGLLPSLQQKVKQLGLDQRVSFLPRAVSGADKEALFQNASLFVLPSYSENFGNVVLEAMIRGCPVVVSREVGACDVVTASGGGLVVEGDPETIAEAVKELFQPGRRELAAIRGKSHVESNYNWDEVAELVESMYLSVR